MSKYVDRVVQICIIWMDIHISNIIESKNFHSTLNQFNEQSRSSKQKKKSLHFFGSNSSLNKLQFHSLFFLVKININYLSEIDF